MVGVGYEERVRPFARVIFERVPASCRLTRIRLGWLGKLRQRLAHSEACHCRDCC